MTTDHIGAAIAAATAEAQPQTDAQLPQENVPTPEEATQELPAEENTETNESGDETREEQFPKKAVNAINRRERKIGKLTAEREQLMAELNKYREQSAPKQPNQSKADDGPKETDFNNYAEYLEARTAYKIEKQFAEYNGKQQETHRTQQEKAWVAEREQYVSTKAQDFIKETPDALAIVQEYSDIADEFSPELQRLFLEADNAPLAFYNLAKEGKLEALMAMSPARAAMEIGMAQAKAPSKPKTKAPTPLPASRGSVPAGKRLEDYTPREALNLMKPKD